MFYARPDLMLSGRTLLGHAPEKGQQLDDHYFGSIPPRVHDFMVDYETEAYKLKTAAERNAAALNNIDGSKNKANVAVDPNILAPNSSIPVQGLAASNNLV
jgi:glutamine synthetase